MAEKLIHTGYYPRKHQEWLHQNLRRFNVITCHRRFGKTVLAINEIIDQAARNMKRNPRYAYIAPTYGQAERVAWQILKDAVSKMPNADINEAKLRVEIQREQDKIQIFLLGSENPGSIRGIYLDGCVIDEYAECDPIIWEQVIRPALSDRRGWAVFIGTPKGTNHFQKIYLDACRLMQEKNSDWFAAMFKASETHVVAESELKAAKETMPDASYRQEFECDFTAAIVGAYYGDVIKAMEDSGRILNFTLEPGYAVDTGWDLGMDDSTAIWFCQQVGREIRMVDYMEVNGKGLPDIVKLLRERGYNYRDHYLPHDISVRELSLSGGKTRLDTLKNLKLGNENLVVVPKSKRKEDDIEAVRNFLPKVLIESLRCELGLAALKAYERIYDSKEAIFRAKPRHNWASHSADAMATLAKGFRGDHDREAKRHLPTMANSEYDIFGV